MPQARLPVMPEPDREEGEAVPRLHPAWLTHRPTHGQVAAKEQAVQAGYRSEPHPDADIAECHLLAGRRSEAGRLFADLRARTPDDVWLYNAAGFSYAGVSDHAESARWFRDGIDVALRTGDGDQVVVQLLDGLEAAWKALAETPEPGLNERVEAFVEAWKPSPRGDRFSWDDLPPVVERRCEHCGYDPDILTGSMGGRVFEAVTEPAPRRQASRLPSSMLVSLAWFPPGEWEKATALCPPRRRYGVAAGQKRPCWCGSGLKYKACCGPIPPAPESTGGEFPLPNGYQQGT
ncbi:MAG TPA: SEC-C domain-containing protein [Acidimicrobiales bacterium]|nr:SEC-C domain-containing protein [Acidimicrobiales bacterium]